MRGVGKGKSRHWLWRLMLVVAVALVSGCGVQGSGQPTATETAPNATPTPNPLASATIAVIEKSLDTYVGRSLSMTVSMANQAPSPDLPKYTGSNPYSVLAYEVSALSLGSRALAATDPARASSYANQATVVADYLVQHKDDNGDGLTGWGLPGAWDAFQDGTTNPANTVYAFQTGLVSDSLLDAYMVTHRAVYLSVVEEAMAAYLSHSTTTVNSQCANCRYFWYSADANDVGRYVKNTNLLIGTALARLAVLTGGAQYRAQADQVFAAQQYEIATRANFRYLGFNDPKYSPTSVLDAHLAAEIWELDDMRLSLSAIGDPIASSALPLLTVMATAFWQCAGGCQASIATDYGVRVACQMAPNAAAERALCEQAIQVYAAAGARALPPYPLLGALRYLTIFGYGV
ncbi:MAG TPA: hypothetical protein VF808_18155 [Ktedonobacterales bacterium]